MNRGSEWYLTIDVCKGFHQAGMDEESIVALLTLKTTILAFLLVAGRSEEQEDLGG